MCVHSAFGSGLIEKVTAKQWSKTFKSFLLGDVTARKSGMAGIIAKCEVKDLPMRFEFNDPPFFNIPPSLG